MKSNNPKPLPPQQYLRECLDYNPDTGKLTWKGRPPHHFATPYQHKLYNSRWPGCGALRNATGRGYIGGAIDGTRYLSHRIIWKLVHNEEPEIVDHINGDPHDNRLCNLRAADKILNMRNIRLRKTNTTGAHGVQSLKSGKWGAHIKTSDGYLWLGTFEAFDDAIAARRNAEAEHGYHHNHGRIA